MLIIFPTGTDAPLYHPPWATGALLLLNFVGFVLQVMFPIQSEAFMLQFGVIQPITWITSSLMHMDFMHLLGNMLAFGIVGWIVEGKVGWWRFLLIYLSIAIFEGAFTQLVMLGSGPGAALGFSGVVYAMIAIAMVWAPENEVELTLVGFFFYRPIHQTLDASIAVLGFFMIALEFLIASFNGFRISSEVLHLIGATPGLLIAIAMIQLRWVDCEGYDLISIVRGRRGKRTRTRADEQAQRERRFEQRRQAQLAKQQGLANVVSYIEAGHYDIALDRFQKLRREDHGLVLPEAQLLALIRAYSGKQETAGRAVPLIKDYLAHYHRNRTPLTLMLARYQTIDCQRPRQGLRTLSTLDQDSLNDQQRAFASKLRSTAKTMVAEGVLEMES